MNRGNTTNKPTRVLRTLSDRNYLNLVTLRLKRSVQTPRAAEKLFRGASRSEANRVACERRKQRCGCEEI
jgi:hypothetical protein